MGDDVELCLEVQVDPATKRILSNPDRCRSVLLDVTVVKPKDKDTTTNTLTPEQVRKLLTNLERKRRHKQKMLDKLKFDDTIVKICRHESNDCLHRTNKRNRVVSRAPVDHLKQRNFSDIGQSVEPLFCEIRRSLKNVETRITDMQDINLIISQTTVEETTSEEFLYRGRQYASCPSSSYDFKKINCYRVGHVNRNCDLKSILNKDRFNTKININQKKDQIHRKCMCENCGIVGLLKDSQKHPLRAELSDSPPPLTFCKDFKRSTLRQPEIDHDNFDNVSYIYQLSKRVKQLEERLAIQEERTVPKDYFKRIIRKIIQSFSPKLSKESSDLSMYMPTAPEPNPDFGNRKTVDDCKSSREKIIMRDENIQCFQTKVSYNNFNRRNQDKATATDDVEENANIWRWGEEVLKPGIDLKNRIVLLLNEILSKFTITEKTSSNGNREGHGICLGGSGNIQNQHATPKLFDNVENFEKEKLALRKTYRSKLNATSPRTSSRNLDKRQSKQRTRFDSSFSTGKQEFYKIISKAKASQKEVLWNNIWNQARANGQTKNDKITVKIPSSDRSGGLCEVELTIREVEEVLKM